MFKLERRMGALSEWKQDYSNTEFVLTDKLFITRPIISKLI